MAYRTKLARQQHPRTSPPTLLSWEPPTTTSLFSSFPGSSAPSMAPPPCPSSAVSASYATLADLPDELLLSITSLLYLPPTEYASAHARNSDLCQLGLAGGPRVQQLVRTVLFEHTTCTTDKEVRWLARRPELMLLVRSLTLQTAPLLLHLPLLLRHLPNLISLTLNCKLTTASVTSILLPVLQTPTAATSTLRSLHLAFAERLSPELVFALADCLPSSLQDLALTTLYMDSGLLSEVVIWEESEIESLLLLLSTKTPDLTALALPLHLLLPPPPPIPPSPAADPTADLPFPLPLEPYRQLWGARAQTLFHGRLRSLRFGGWSRVWDAQGKGM